MHGYGTYEVRKYGVLGVFGAMTLAGENWSSG